MQADDHFCNTPSCADSFCKQTTICTTFSLVLMVCASRQLLYNIESCTDDSVQAGDNAFDVPSSVDDRLSR